MEGRLFGALARARSALAGRELLLLSALLVALPCGALLAIEVQSLGGPLYGVHEWRQAWTYSVAHAFVHEAASFFYPKHAWRGALTGIVGMEVPIYPYVVSLLMRVFGDAPLWGRLLNFVFCLLAFGLQARKVSMRFGAATALGYAVMLAFSPMVLSEFRQFQPDPLMTAFSVLAAVCFQSHAQHGDHASFALGIVLYGLALFTKSIAIAVLPAMYLFAVLGSTRPRLLGLVVRAACFAPALVGLFCWDRWANELVHRFMEGRSLISIDHDPARMWLEAQSEPAQRLIFLGLLENWVTHCVLFPAVLLGLIQGVSQRPTRAFALAFITWFVGVSAISLAFSSRYANNWYYMLLFAPPIAFFGALGLGAFFEVVCLGARDARRLGICLALVTAGALISHRLTPVPWASIEHVPQQLAVHVRQRFTSHADYWQLMALGALVAVLLLGGRLVALKSALFARVPGALLGLVLAAVATAAMVVPFRDVRQTVRFYTGELEWSAGRLDQAEIRAAVDRYSTSRDLFVMNGANPALLVRALRVGFADDAGFIDWVGRDFYVKQGARFFMSFQDSGPVPVSMQGAPLLEQGPRWQLFCIDPKGCPLLSKDLSAGAVR